MTKQYKIHELANLIPKMTEQEYQNLKEDIKANGLEESIILFEDKILDGRHRYRACSELGIEPEYETLEESYEYATHYVLSLNVHRRHLTDSQRAISAANIIQHSREHKTVPNGTKSSSKKTPPFGGKKQSVRKVAKLLNTKTRNVERVLKVNQSNNKKLISKMESGIIPISLAAKIVTNLSESEQKAIIDKPKKEIIQAINKKLNKTIKSVPMSNTKSVPNNTKSVSEQTNDPRAVVIIDGQTLETIDIDLKLLNKITKKAKKQDKPISTIINKLLKKALSPRTFTLIREQYDILVSEQEILNKNSHDKSVQVSVREVFDHIIDTFIEETEQSRQAIQTTLPFNPNNFEEELTERL